MELMNSYDSYQLPSTTFDVAGAWVAKQSGVRYNVFEPTVEMVNIYDIANALARMPRFSGATSNGSGSEYGDGYSVAQHSFLVSRHCTDPRDRLWGLLHDAHEAYLGDIPAPIKAHPSFAFWRELAQRSQDVICDKFDLPHRQPEDVTLADVRMLVTESRVLMPDFCTARIAERIKAAPYDDVRLLPVWSASEARAIFLAEFHSLGGVA